ncbi:MAG: XTP/dITP diphosphatase [Candidatus Eisenbacteria bacterium]
MRRVVLATRNAHKIEELSAMLTGLPIEVLSFADFPDLPEVVEDGTTLEANAVKKAERVAAFTGLPSLADDTGLEVKALGGAPGVHSARYAGESATGAANNAKLLAELAGIAGGERAAAFRCVVALAAPGDETRTVEGATHGVILEAPRGEGGFGYDPLFLPDGHARSYAEMTSAEKNTVSHRGKAIKRASALLRSLVKEQ